MFSNWRFLKLSLLCFTLQFFCQGKAGASDMKCLSTANCSECLLQGDHCVWCFKSVCTTHFLLHVQSLCGLMCKLQPPTSMSSSQCMAELPTCIDIYSNDPDFTQAAYQKEGRCDTISNHLLQNCDSWIKDPVSQLHFLKNESLKNANVDNSSNIVQEAVQITPQKVHIQIQPGRPVTIPLQFRIAEDYPVDLYYIMDLSHSMIDDQKNLIRLATSLEKELKNISRNSRMGFGAFIDKPIEPFIGTRQVSLQNPCFPANVCEPAYSFINQLPLTTNTSIFGRKVALAPISGNQDGPEGGLDGLLQAMVCESEIGWRPTSRKIILYSTDAKSHIASDAKVAGIVEPNDGYCHLVNNTYSYSLHQDYPSISQIASIAKKTSTSIIFAVANYLLEYKEISKFIPSSAVGLLANDSSNIVKLVKEQYESLIKVVNLRVLGIPTSSDIKVVIKSNCSQSDGVFVENSVCDSVRIGEYVHFEIEVSLQSCANHLQNQSFLVKSDDLSDNLQVDVEIFCQCDCNDKTEKDAKCSGAGTYSCGLCSCDSGFSGEKCECDSQASKPKDSCDNVKTGLMCSGHGECDSCGNCQCDCLPGGLEPLCDRYTGPVCQCNNKACSQRNGRLCSGRGNCTCDPHSFLSVCQCESGYLGADCSCPVSDVTCRSKENMEVLCNGKGTCNCGKCTCIDQCYEGAVCSILKPECGKTCISFRECAACYTLSGAACTHANGSCSSYNVKEVTRIDEESPGACFYIDQQGCENHYLYEYKSGWNLYILLKPQCQKEYWLEIIIGICVGVLVLGVTALIIWKQAVTIHDKREFARFQAEAQRAKWKTTNNPLYKPATSMFKNPMYSAVEPGMDRFADGELEHSAKPLVIDT
ncbi:pat-3 [Bugula neritina]|uniref:Integrin beta n=1 Tax=Bugula neritina TaxID=10212 RepID=A0A7J7KMY6_BUGNE|nr:pat-3 [Bugula neritina]